MKKAVILPAKETSWSFDLLLNCFSNELLIHKLLVLKSNLLYVVCNKISSDLHISCLNKMTATSSTTIYIGKQTEPRDSQGKSWNSMFMNGWIEIKDGAKA
ncbi:hypothetical protein SAY87_018683 [Trapa incisa]|uniref:Uncharacterized protein n=1 Tax=Trapa incisa TaxID=236973 RepID=A0AAN7Q0F0_9MYRT|nr:hypothetical protein SAY87_018683 [Trapa incisa]